MFSSIPRPPAIPSLSCFWIGTSLLVKWHRFIVDAEAPCRQTAAWLWGEGFWVHGRNKMKTRWEELYYSSTSLHWKSGDDKKAGWKDAWDFGRKDSETNVPQGEMLWSEWVLMDIRTRIVLSYVEAMPGGQVAQNKPRMLRNQNTGWSRGCISSRQFCRKGNTLSLMEMFSRQWKITKISHNFKVGPWNKQSFTVTAFFISLRMLMGKEASDKMMLLWSWNLCAPLFYVWSRWPPASPVIWPFSSPTCLLFYCSYELFYRNIKCELLSPFSTTIIHSSN